VTITILQFHDYDAVKELFGEAVIGKEGYMVQNWSQRNFRKAWRNDDVDAEMRSLEVHYNKSKQTLSLQFRGI